MGTGSGAHPCLSQCPAETVRLLLQRRWGTNSPGESTVAAAPATMPRESGSISILLDKSSLLKHDAETGIAGRYQGRLEQRPWCNGDSTRCFRKK